MAEEVVEKPHVVALSIRGMRSLADVYLDLDGLTVLIGDNGSGKSTIIEALELVRRAPEPNFVETVSKAHGGLTNLIRASSSSLELGVNVRAGKELLGYRLSLSPDAPFGVLFEKAVSDSSDQPLIERTGDKATVWDDQQQKMVDGPKPNGLRGTLLSMWGPGGGKRRLIWEALSEIDVQLPFSVMASWGARELALGQSARSPQPLEPATRLDRFGRNLASAFHALRNERSPQHWEETMRLVRQGLGENIDDIPTPADSAGGVSLRIRLREPAITIHVSGISDGTLAYLSYVAMQRLAPQRSVLAFDEPELHLHPRLLGRVVGLFESMARQHPVLLSTHSDRVLDCLQHPERSAVLCELNEMGETVLKRPDAAVLKKWLERYSGLGQIRAEGHEQSIFVDDVKA